jgi:hypothetical protein
MTAFIREFPDTDWYTCRVGGISTALRNMDAKTVKAMNGTAGSSHAPAAPIVIGGSGMVAAGLWAFSGVCTTGPGAHIVHGAGHAADYLRLGSGHPGVSRSMTIPCLPCVPDSYLGTYATAENNFSFNTRYPGGRNLIPLTPHDKSTLATARLLFKVRFAHAGLPEFPKFRIIRVDQSGNVEALHTSRSGSYKDEGFLDLPASVANVAAYEAGVAWQWSNTYTTDQNNVVDLAKYAYFIDFVEEDGARAFAPNVGLSAGAGTQVLRGEMTCSSISNLGPQ